MAPQKADPIVDVPLGKLTVWERNPRLIQPARFDALVRSMEESRAMLYARPLIALRDGRVIAGNMRLRAAQKLGWKKIPTVYVDIDEQTAVTWALRDNNAYGEWDENGLTDLLNELHSEGLADVELLGFTHDDLALLDLDFNIDDALRNYEPSTNEPPADRGENLALADVSIGDPKNSVASGEVWDLGHHMLVCGGVYDGWQVWAPLLEEGCLFAPYPTPTVVLSDKAKTNRLVLVQPDPWLAGHIIDKYAAIYGDEQVAKR